MLVVEQNVRARSPSPTASTCSTAAAIVHDGPAAALRDDAARARRAARRVTTMAAPLLHVDRLAKQYTPRPAGAR